MPRFAAAYTDQARAFGRSIQNDEAVTPSGADGRAAFLIALAADLAIRDGGTIRVEGSDS
jgi:predicted dehydrogenase